MGVCLGTEQDDDETNQNDWGSDDNFEFNYLAENTPANNQFAMPNTGNISFEKPKVPVIFILGGPGSGRVTHSEHYAHDNPGIVHINMSELLQQYAIGDGSSDFTNLSSKILTEALMLEMKLSPTSSTYLITGYPRNMRDAVEFSKKIKETSGVILISWRRKILERQIDYGAKLGKIILSVAQIELNNFFVNTLQVVDFYDQNGMLIMINGERYPNEVYKDFRFAVERIIYDFKQRQMGIFQTKKVPTNIDEETIFFADEIKSPIALPPIIWILGGPGSNKSEICKKIIQKYHGWSYFSISSELRSIANANVVTNETKKPDSQPQPELLYDTEQVTKLKHNLSIGKLIDDRFVYDLLEKHIRLNSKSKGILICGYPRNMQQMDYFEEKYEQKPDLILLDCSKLQIGRGRLDDNVAAFRKRLEIFREFTLPMLRKFDNWERLTIVNGDVHNEETKTEFEKCVRERIEKSERIREQNTDTAGTNIWVPNSESATEHELRQRNDEPERKSSLEDYSLASISNKIGFLFQNMKKRRNSSRVVPQIQF